MILDKIVFSAIQPASGNILWAKPVKDGFTLYINVNGRWQSMKMVDDKDTVSPDDDAEIDLDNIPTMDTIDEKIQEEVTEQIGTQVEDEVTRQMNIHDAEVGDTHNTSSGDSQDYPEVSIFG